MVLYIIEEGHSVKADRLEPVRNVNKAHTLNAWDSLDMMRSDPKKRFNTDIGNYPSRLIRLIGFNTNSPINH